MDRREFDRRGKKDKMKDKTDSAERGDTRKQNKRERHAGFWIEDI